MIDLIKNLHYELSKEFFNNKSKVSKLTFVLALTPILEIILEFVGFITILLYIISFISNKFFNTNSIFYFKDLYQLSFWFFIFSLVMLVINIVYNFFLFGFIEKICNNKMEQVERVTDILYYICNKENIDKENTIEENEERK